MNDLDTSAERDRPVITIERLWTDYEPDPANPGKMKPVDWVSWIKKGEHLRSTIIEKIARLVGGDRLSPDGTTKYYEPDVVWKAIEPHYKRWKANEAAIVEGTPLEAWPGLTPEQVRVFKGANMLSVEDVAGMNESVIMRIGLPGIRQIKDRARAFLTAQSDTSKIEAVIASRDAKIEAQEREMAEMRETLAELMASRNDPPKRGPGRPPKIEADAA